ncbi:hypothetical protein DB30_03863 [Enhygromyxa salina]|uniref:Uncharacterized protein n=1 Tax=Enhygromyxa salina TaxID=215803 RepID=A0A0C2DI01_9BACT|nr:general secretion pathway protein GspK [Enhygromyxa salina]KIG19307.1 hypothetical protein DB30_03863 [Enhygromyxa salina]
MYTVPGVTNRHSTKLLGLACLLGLVACSEEPEASESPFASVEITRVELGRDLDPAYLNERIPITIGITASSGVAGEVPTEAVPLVVTFVDPQDPEEVGCSSNGMLFDIVGDGEEHEYEGFIWPPSNCIGLTGKTVTLQIELDPTAEQPLIEPLVLSQARANEPANAACRGPEPGCVQEFRLEVPESSLVDIEFAGLESESSVGVIPSLAFPTEGEVERAAPILVAQNMLVFNGRDPYESPVNPDTIPAELLAADPDIAEALRFGRPADQIDTIDDLPGALHLEYAITAAADGETWLPLAIGEGDVLVDEAVITELLPGTPNLIAHDLYLEGAAYDAVLDPDQWLGEEAFVVRSCFTTDFGQFRGVADEAKCRTLEVLLVPPSDVESGVSTFGFNRVEKSSHGNSRIKLESRFATSNQVGLDGVFSNTEANLTVKGKIGKSFTLDIVRANATLDAPLSGERSVDVGLRLFNDDVFRYTDQATGLTVSEDVVFSKSTTLVKAKFMFGPVPLSFDLGAGGAVGILAEGSANFFQGESDCRPHLPLATAGATELRAEQEQVIADLQSKIAEQSNPIIKKLLRSMLQAVRSQFFSGNAFDTGEASLSECVTLEASVGPTMNLTASAFGGIDIGIARAGVQLDLVIAQVDLPLTGKLSLGRNDLSQFVAFASTDLDLVFQPLDGDLKLVGKLKLGPFKRSKSVSIVKFNVKPIEKSLLRRSTLAAEVLSL